MTDELLKDNENCIITDSNANSEDSKKSIINAIKNFDYEKLFNNSEGGIVIILGVNKPKERLDASVSKGMLCSFGDIKNQVILSIAITDKLDIMLKEMEEQGIKYRGV